MWKTSSCLQKKMNWWVDLNENSFPHIYIRHNKTQLEFCPLIICSQLKKKPLSRRGLMVMKWNDVIHTSSGDLSLAGEWAHLERIPQAGTMTSREWEKWLTPNQGGLVQKTETYPNGGRWRAHRAWHLGRALDTTTVFALAALLTDMEMSYVEGVPPHRDPLEQRQAESQRLNETWRYTPIIL
jgi:hypothetical protein